MELEVPVENAEQWLGINFKIKPWKHQIDGLMRSKDLQNFAFFFQTGTGKTATAINALRVKFNKAKKILPTIVFGPPIVLENWRREFLMHSSIDADRLVVLYGTQTQRVKLFEETQDSPKIYITNYESLLMKDLFSCFMRLAPEAIVFDEVHKLKDPKAKRSVQAAHLADRAKYKFILTGSPILNSLMDIFQQYRVMDGGKTFGSNFYGFRATYFYNANASAPAHVSWQDWRARPNAAHDIRELMSKSSMQVSKESCLDLPPLVRERVFVEMSPDQRRMYNSMFKDFIAFLNDKACVAELALTKGLRLLQIVSGFATVEDGQNDRQDIRFKENPRAEALKELLTTLTPQHKVLVWATFKTNYAQIRDVLEGIGLKYVEVNGSVSQLDKQRAVDRFNTDETVRVFVGHPGSAGIGINLVSASYSIYYSRNFSLEQDLQSEARNYRGGSEIHAKITRIDIVARGTIDEDVLEALSTKQAISDTVLRGIVSRSSERIK